MCSLEKFGIVDQNGLNLLVRFVAENAGRGSGVGDNNSSQSRFLSIWSKGGLMNRLLLVGAIACRVA